MVQTYSPLEVLRLEKCVEANHDDACLWRWFSDLMEDGRITWERQRGGWLVSIDGTLFVSNVSFDAALRTAKADFPLIAKQKAASASRRRRK